MEQSMIRNYAVPAPNTYSPNMGFTQSKVLPRGAVTKIGRNKFDIIRHRWGIREQEDKPGPGEYEIKDLF
jgi:hypothetical protein